MPWKRETFKFSTDPELEAKVRDVVGLYLNPPPERAVVLCVDEKTQIQALDRTAPILPLRPGLPEKVTHDYKRNGITSLFAALEVATGKVTDACYQRHTHAEFLDFLKLVAKAYPRVKLHVVADNYATHKHPKVRAWLGSNPRITMHNTATSGSWLNMVEIFFGIITRQAIRRGTTTGVKDLINADPDAWYHGDPDSMGEENFAEWRAAIHDPAVVRGMLEDYRAGLGIDADHERADRQAGRQLQHPLLALWSTRDDLEDLYGNPLIIWQDWAHAVSGHGIDSGHHMAEQAPEELTKALTVFLAPTPR